MFSEAGNLAHTVKAMRPMVPAKDFEISKRFYADLGFRPRTLMDGQLVEMHLGAYSSDGYRLGFHGLEQRTRAFELHARQKGCGWSSSSPGPGHW
jgi:catechol 2,3-dioxygenase-like lactoylglutathione lyase family enzyme